MTSGSNGSTGTTKRDEIRNARGRRALNGSDRLNRGGKVRASKKLWEFKGESLNRQAAFRSVTRPGGKSSVYG